MTTMPRWKADLRLAYDADADARGGRPLEPWRRLLLQTVIPDGQQRIVDLGCGTGRIAEDLRRDGHDVIGVDLSLGNAAATTARGVSAVVGDIAATPFHTGGFDAAVAFNSLLHVPVDDLAGHLDEIRRLLVPGGVFLWVVWGGHDRDGPSPTEWLDPPRRFVLHSDETFASLPTPGFRRRTTTFLHDQPSGAMHPQVAVLVAG